MFAEFLLSFLVFPCGHTGVGLTVNLRVFFLFSIVWPYFLFVLGPLKIGGGSFRRTRMQGESLILLLLILAWSLPWGHGTAWYC